MKKPIKVHVVAGVLIKKDNKYLLIQEGPSKPKVHGLWNFPGGKVDEGETLEEAAVREAKEETGFDVEVKRKLNVFHEKCDESVRHAFEVEILGGELSFDGEEIMNAKWFTLSEIESMKEKLRSGWILYTLKSLEKESMC